MSPIKKGSVERGEKPDGRDTLTAEPYEGLLAREQLLSSYKLMLLARRLDEKELALLKQGKAFFHIGGRVTKPSRSHVR